MARSSTLSPEQRRAQASYAAHMSHVQRDGSDRTAAARRTFRERFDHYADPDGILHPEERTRRGDKLWRSWWSYLRYHSAMGTKAITLPEWLAQYAPGAERVAER